MSSIDSAMDSLKDLIESVKDMPTEKVAAVGLMIIGTIAAIKSIASDDSEKAIGEGAVVDEQ